jgi:hypothetical protein
MADVTAVKARVNAAREACLIPPSKSYLAGERGNPCFCPIGRTLRKDMGEAFFLAVGTKHVRLASTDGNVEGDCASNPQRLGRRRRRARLDRLVPDEAAVAAPQCSCSPPRHPCAPGGLDNSWNLPYSEGMRGAQSQPVGPVREHRRSAPQTKIGQPAFQPSEPNVSNIGLSHSTISFLRLWTNATTSRFSASGTWNFARVAAA